MDIRKEPKSQLAFGLYNWGRLVAVHHRRRDAVKDAEAMTGEPWAKCRSYYEIHRVRVERYAP